MDNNNNESQVKTVSEIFGCSHDEAKEMLVKCEWDINRVLDKCANESGMEIESSSTSRDSSEATGDGISSVLKRKKHAEEPEVVIIDENEKKRAKEDFEEEAFLGPTTEPCPACSAPNFLPDKGLARYTCVECGADTCRLCYMQAHGEGQECVKEGYKKVTVLPSKNFDAENDLDRDFRIAEGQFLRMMSKRKNYEIKSIEIVKNDELEKKFNAKKREFKELGIDDKPLLIFHGTLVENIEAILRHNFDLRKVSNGRSFGDGVYFSEKPEVSVRYTRDWKPMSSLILCLVLKGINSKEVTSPATFVNTEETSNGAWAIVVPNTDQILPKYVINFKEVVERSNFSQSIRPRFGGLSGIGHVNTNHFLPAGTSAPSSCKYKEKMKKIVSALFSQQDHVIPPPTPVQAPAQASPAPSSYKEWKMQKKVSALFSQQSQAVPPPTLVQAPAQASPTPSTSQASPAPADPHQLVQQFPTLMQDLLKLQKMLQSPLLQQAMNMTLSTQDPQANTEPPVQKETANEDMDITDDDAMGLPSGFSVGHMEKQIKENKQTFYCQICLVELPSLDSMKSHVAGLKHQKKEMTVKKDRDTGSAGTDPCIDGSADETLVATRERELREDAIGGVVLDNDEGSANTGTDNDDCVGRDFLVEIGGVWLSSRIKEEKEGN